MFIVNYSSSQWTQISTIGNNELRAVKFFNEFTGIVVGEGGIWRSTNSGVNWVQTLSDRRINGLSFVDNNNGYAVGDSGKIYRTIDGGINWTQQGLGVTTNNLYAVCFSTNTRCNIAGVNGIILRSLNGGASWSIQGIGGPDIFSIIMNTPGEGYTFGSLSSEVVRSTVNGGTNWVTLLNITGNSCYDGTFLSNAGTLIVAGSNGRIRKTTNYGQNWSFPQSNVSIDLRAVYFIDELEGYITGNSGTILKSSNAGANWTIQISPTSNDLHDIYFIDQQTGWAVGTNGVVIKTGSPVGIQQSYSAVVSEFTLFQNYPNPFNPATDIRFYIPVSDWVRVSIYDVKGDKLAELLNGVLQAGFHRLRFETDCLPSGIYFCKLYFKGNMKVIKLVLIK